VIGFEVKTGAHELNSAAFTAFKKKFPRSRVILVGDQGMKWQKFLQLDLEEIIAI
jgi:hypothetical protein